MMNRQTFNETMKTIISRELGAAYQVSLEQLVKVNQTLDALVVRKENGVLGLSIYLNPYFEMYSQVGGDMERYASKLLDDYADRSMEAAMASFDLTFLKDKESILGKVYYRIINRGKNQELLNNAPHTALFGSNELVRVYCILVSNGEDGISSITLTHSLMEQFHLSEEEVVSNAVKNTPLLFPATFKAMKDVLGELMGYLVDDCDVPLWVLSNEQNVNGASAMGYENLLDKIATQLGTSFYVLPSSLHEVLICTNLEMPPAILREMVQMVNEDQVAESDFLSDEVFYYDYDNHSLSVA